MNQQNLSANSAINISENVICETSHLGIIKISGDDATEFLQGQFSNDVTLVNENTSQLNSYNSPKGRMYCSFQLCQKNSDYFMILPNDIMEMVSKRLRMFVMRAKVEIEDISQQWSSLGIAGKSLTGSSLNIPNEINATSQREDGMLIRLPGTVERVIAIGNNAFVETLKQPLVDSYKTADHTHWKRLDIHAGIPNIYHTTLENFVPQMVNLPLVNGVSFNKGCYPGQEVVARMHYLGKLKKRMYRITIDTQELPHPGDNIYESNTDNQQSVGEVVDAQFNSEGQVDSLAVIQVASAENNTLHLSKVHGPLIRIETLPYSFEQQK